MNKIRKCKGVGVHILTKNNLRSDAIIRYNWIEKNLEDGIAFQWLRDVARINMSLVTAVPTGFRDHTGFWILRPSAARDKLRAWVYAITNG